MLIFLKWEKIIFFLEANSNGISLFREFVNGIIGLEDIHGGSNNNFYDWIFGHDLKLTI